MATEGMRKVENKIAIRNRVLKWFDGKDRNLPWLENRSPYKIWVSEIMLQQTQIVTVVEYFKRFIRQYPNVGKLAAAKVDDVLKLWEGLGYYRRARQLHKAAQVIVDQHSGKFPEDFTAVLALPGIGRYTAAAILSIAKDQAHPILEGNTIRLFSRLMALEEDVGTSSAQKKLWQFSEQLLTPKRPGDFNQAVMDLGREVCKPKEPLCSACPVSTYCPTYVRGLQSRIPIKKRKMQYEELREAIVLVKRSGRFLLRKCQPGERWAGLWDFPRTTVAENDEPEVICDKLFLDTGLQVAIEPLNRTIKHGVTRFRITLDCYQSSEVSGTLKRSSSLTWMNKKQIKDLPLSATGRKVADLYV